MIHPTIVYKSTTGRDELSVWPPIPGGNTNPVIQIDHGGHRHAVVEFRPEDGPALAAAILQAAAEATLKRP